LFCLTARRKRSPRSSALPRPFAFLMKMNLAAAFG
jgi:hypothetical protein